MKTRNFRIQKKHSDRTLPEALTILALLGIRPATEIEDMKQASDAIFVQTELGSAGIRIRAPGVWERFRRQFTIRSYVGPHIKTEYHKIMKGFGKLYLYGHRDDNFKITRYCIFDLDIFRSCNPLLTKGLDWGETTNTDGTRFYWYEMDAFGRDFVRDSKGMNFDWERTEERRRQRVQIKEGFFK